MTDFDARATLEHLLGGEGLTEEQATALMRYLAQEDTPPAQAGALLAALRAKGETAAEIRGFAQGMRELAVPTALPSALPAADCVGTGGDASGSFNLSTGAALLAAACRVPMIKHGNRSVSSKSGSADVLKELGVPLPETPEKALACLEATDFAFLFAPYFHPAMKAIAPVRGAMGVRTVFNILGPLSNPAAPPFHVIGAFSLEMAELMAETLVGMDVDRAFVIHGEPGWDEATPCGPFTLFDVSGGEVKREERDPADYGLERCAPEDLAGGDAGFNARSLEAVFEGVDKGAHRDALCLAAGLVLEVTGRAADLAEGIQKAASAIDNGAAAVQLDKLRRFAAEA